MKIPIIRIGNSKGLRLSKTILEKYQLQDSAELILEEDQIIIRPNKSSRHNWDKSFSNMADNDDDTLLIDHVFDDESFEEWK